MPLPMAIRSVTLDDHELGYGVAAVETDTVNRSEPFSFTSNQPNPEYAGLIGPKTSCRTIWRGRRIFKYKIGQLDIVV